MLCDCMWCETSLMSQMLTTCPVRDIDTFFLLFLFLCGFIGCGVLLYYKLRPRFPVRVICWFCGKDTVVPFGNCNCWDCPFCDQYNGFKEDGDYNKPIPAQYDESLNFPVLGSASRNSAYKYKFSSSNGLCSDCNNNQSIKMKLLAEFVPFNQVNFSEEVNAFHRHLEKVYRLCWECEMNVQKTLYQQDLEFQSKLPPIFNNSSNAANTSTNSFTIPPSCFMKLPLGVHILDIISLLSLVALLLTGIFEVQEESKQLIFKLSWLLVSQLPTASSLLVIGMITSIGGIFWAGMSRVRTVDALLAFSWVLLQCFYSVVMSHFLPMINFTLIRPFLVFLTLLISLVSAFWRLTVADLGCKMIRTQKIIRPSVFSPSQPSLINREVEIQSYENSNCRLECAENMQQQHADPLIPLRRGIGAIHISTPIKKSSSEASSTVSSQLTSYKSSQSLRPIIRPARFTLHPVAHTSWVAGGYWSLQATSKTRHNISPSAGLLTPPPSVCGSQESRSASRAGSVCGDDGYSSCDTLPHWSIHSSTIRSWPPSASRERLLKWDKTGKAVGGSYSHSSSTNSTLLPENQLQASETHEMKRGGKWQLFAWLSLQWLMLMSLSINVALLSYFVILPKVQFAL